MEDVRRVAREIMKTREIKSMDKNGDGKISLHEFMAHLSNQYTHSFFNLLHQNGDGFLQFEDLFTLTYIVTSCRPFCVACTDFIPGLFFTCTRCRLTPKNYDLCIHCYHGRNFEHPHAEFDDNYTPLLKLQRMLLSAQHAKPSESSQSSPSRRSRLKATMKKSFGRIGESGVWCGGWNTYIPILEFHHPHRRRRRWRR